MTRVSRVSSSCTEICPHLGVKSMRTSSCGLQISCDGARTHVEAEELATGKGPLTASPRTLPETADAHHTCMIMRHECKEVKPRCQWQSCPSAYQLYNTPKSLCDHIDWQGRPAAPEPRPHQRAIRLWFSSPPSLSR
jgi:hypothetical protein